MADITEHGGNMREIKFRGKSIDTREWVYGYYIKSGPDYHGGERHSIATPGTVADYAGLKFIQVDPKTVGQFIGIPDKNGREIYEGDSVYIDCSKECSRDVEGIVKYEFGSFNVDEEEINYSFGDIPDEIYVTGNIHENPELLS